MSKTGFRCLTISANEGKRVQNERGNHVRRYRVTIKSDATDVERWFTYTTSEADEEAGRIGLGPDQLLWAFRCFVDDGIAGDQPFTDFAADFGYDQDSYTARRTWQACRESARKLRELFHAEPDAYAIIEELSAMGVE